METLSFRTLRTVRSRTERWGSTIFLKFPLASGLSGPERGELLLFCPTQPEGAITVGRAQKVEYSWAYTCEWLSPETSAHQKVGSIPLRKQRLLVTPWVKFPFGGSDWPRLGKHDSLVSEQLCPLGPLLKLEARSVSVPGWRAPESSLS